MNEKSKQFSVSHLARVFGVSQQTIRQWSNEFQEHLSIRANPGKSRVRSFTNEDLPVLALISQMKELGYTYQEIHAALNNGERGEAPSLNGLDLALTSERDRTAIAELETRVQQAEEERDFWRERATEAERLLQERDAALHQSQVELARLQGEMKAAERDRSQLDQQQKLMEYQQNQFQQLLAERDRLNKELMAIYRRLAAVEASDDEQETK
jgi:DNA-binding transcriptional MerR regulator